MSIFLSQSRHVEKDKNKGNGTYSSQKPIELLDPSSEYSSGDGSDKSVPVSTRVRQSVTVTVELNQNATLNRAWRGQRLLLSDHDDQDHLHKTWTVSIARTTGYLEHHPEQSAIWRTSKLDWKMEMPFTSDAKVDVKRSASSCEI